MVKKYILKSLLVIGPYLVILGIPIAILVIGKETADIDHVIKMQQSKAHTVLLGKAYTNPDRYYKLQSILLRHPRIIALGSSRVFKFRSKFFSHSEDFFNAARVAMQLRHVRQFMKYIPIHDQPQIAIINMDQWWFSEDYENDKEEDSDLPFDGKPILSDVICNWKKVWRDLFSKKIPFSLLNTSYNNAAITPVGISAMIGNNGFRNDGSYFNGGYNADPCNPKNRFVKDINMKIAREYIQEGKGFMSHCSRISPSALVELDSLLDLFRSRHIYAVAYIPPVLHKLYTMLEANKIDYPDFFGLDSVLAPHFKARGFQLFDYTDHQKTGASDNENAEDVYHVSEKATLRLFIDMAEKDSVLRREVNIPYLKEKLSHAQGNFEVFGEEY